MTKTITPLKLLEINRRREQLGRKPISMERALDEHTKYGGDDEIFDMFITSAVFKEPVVEE